MSTLCPFFTVVYIRKMEHCVRHNLPKPLMLHAMLRQAVLLTVLAPFHNAETQNNGCKNRKPKGHLCSHPEAVPRVRRAVRLTVLAPFHNAETQKNGCRTEEHNPKGHARSRTACTASGSVYSLYAIFQVSL